MNLAKHRELAFIEMPVMAQPLLDYLRKAGIEAKLASDDMGGVNPALAFVHGTYLIVPEPQYERARTLYEEFRDSVPLFDCEQPELHVVEDSVPQSNWPHGLGVVGLLALLWLAHYLFFAV